VQGLTVVIGRRRGHVPLRIDLAIVGARVDACVVNPGMADVGRFRHTVAGGLRIPDYLCSVGFEVWIAAFLNRFIGSIRPLDGAFIIPQNVPLRQMADAAGMEVAEWRDDKICRYCRWAVWSSGNLGCG